MTYRWTGSHAYRDHANDRVIEPGDKIPEDIADQVVDHHPHDVDAVEEAGSDDGDGADSVSDENTDNDDGATSEDAFDVDEWLDQDYQTRADRVNAGDVDDHLQEIKDAETSGNVKEAIADRRDELEA